MDINSRIPKYEAVRQDVEKRIRNGSFSCGEYLPSELELANFYGVGRNTIRRAISPLFKAGILTKQQGALTKIVLDQKHFENKRIAWFSYFKSEEMFYNLVYFELFQNLSFHAICHGFQLDFFCVTEESNWNTYFHNQNEYIGCVVVGINEFKMEQEYGHIEARKILDRLGCIPNIVGIDCDFSGSRHNVNAGNLNGVRDAVAYLASRGYKNIKFISLWDKNFTRYKGFEYRGKGFEKAMIALHLKYDKNSIVYDFSGYYRPLECREKSGFAEACKKLVDGADAIISCTDDCAIKIMLALQNIGIKVPEDIGIVGFDGTYPGQHILPRLTSVQQQTGLMAQEAFKVVMEAYANPSCPSRNVSVPCRLLVGESTR